MDDFQERLEKMGAAILPYAKAKAERIYIEQYRKSLKAMGMARSEGKTIADREADAYTAQEYLNLLAGLKAAVEIEEAAKWALEKLKIEVEVWRTNCANDRWQKDRV